MQLWANSLEAVAAKGKEVENGRTSQLTTTQLGDLHVVVGARHCSGAPGPVVTSYRSDSGPNCVQYNTNNLIQLKNNPIRGFALRGKNTTFIFY